MPEQKTPFFGPLNVSRSKNVADNRLINLYPEVVDTRDGKEIGAFYNTPGLDLLATAGSGPIRGSIVVGSTEYVVSGNTVYTISALWVETSIGTIGTALDPVSMVSNGDEILLVDGAKGYVIDVSAGTVTEITSAGFPSGPLTAFYQDGFFLVNVTGTQSWYQSNLNDATTWNALNFSSKDAQPDPVVAGISSHREVWLLGSQKSEVWINAGSSGFAFQRLNGVFIEEGCSASFSVCRGPKGVLAWLATSERGGYSVQIANGYTPQRISTHALETSIAGYSTVSDAIGFCYEEAGHTFYQLTFPSGGETWVYDFTTSALLGMPAWHQRAEFSGGLFKQHQASCYAWFNGKHTVGDHLSGNIYALNNATYTDNGATRKWLRTWRALQTPTNQPVTFDSLQIDMETGITIGAGTNPMMMMRWSDDGGHNWSNEQQKSMGQTGETAKRVKFNRLGSTRYSTGLDRIFEISGTAQMRTALIGATLEASPA